MCIRDSPNIEAITLASNMPGIGAVRHPITTDKINLDEHVVLPCISADYDFVQTFDLKVIAGRNFGKEYGTDHIDGYLLNEKAVKTLGWDAPEDAIGQKIAKGGKTGKVLGVINDFHIQGLQEELEPVVLDINVGSFTTFAIRIKNPRLPETLD